VERQLIEFSAVAMQRQDFKKTDDMFNRVLGKDHIATVCLLENRHTGSRLILANTHIHWDAAFRDVKLVQVALLVEEIEKVAADFAKYPPKPPPVNGFTEETGPPPPAYSDGSKIPVVICSDLNSVVTSGVYEFMANGSIEPNHEDFMNHIYGKLTSEGMKHHLGLKSAYSPNGAEMSITNYTAGFQGLIDYVWYSNATLAVNRVLGEVDKKYLEKVVGFPNCHFPSECVASFPFISLLADPFIATSP
jgi:CCR4-NOT transcription complex subunit 6